MVEIPQNCVTSKKHIGFKPLKENLCVDRHAILVYTQEHEYLGLVVIEYKSIFQKLVYNKIFNSDIMANTYMNLLALYSIKVDFLLFNCFCFWSST